MKINKKLVTALVWGLIAMGIVWMASGMDMSSKRVDELEYNSFLSLVEATETKTEGKDHIYAIQIESRDVYGVYAKSSLSEDALKQLAKKLPKSADFHTVIPSEATFRADVGAIILAARPGDFASVDEISSNDYSFNYDSKLTEVSIWISLLPTIILLVGMGAIYYFMLRQQGGGKQMMNFGRARTRMLGENDNRVTFEDVAGADEEKAELQEIVEFMKAPEKFNALGAHVPKGVLLVGPPGTGKTLLAKAVAGEAKAPFFSISGSDFVEMFVGVGASRVRDLFETAKRSTPAVIFIDEIDAVGRHRGAGMGGGHDEREQTLNQLLVEMDGFAANQGIIVLAATNRPDILDPALLRPGRFDRQITVNTPDVKGREAILKVHARNKPFAGDVDLHVLAQRTPGFTGADLENVLNEGAILAARENADKITMKHLENAINRVQMGPEKRSRLVTDLDKKLTAYHEAGHAIVALKMEHCDPVHEVSIIPRGSAGGYTMMLPKEDTSYTTKCKLLDTIAMSLGGRVAEKLRMGDISTGAYSDLQHASSIARAMVTEYGMSDAIGPIFLGGQTEVFIGMEWGKERNYSEDLAARVDEEIRRILDEQFARAEAAISEDMDAFDRVAQLLMKYERVTGEAFAAVYRGENAEEVMSSKKSDVPGAEARPEEPAASARETAADAAQAEDAVKTETEE